MKKLIAIIIILGIIVYLIILGVANTDKKEFNDALKKHPQADSLRINDTIYHFKTKDK